MSIVVATSGGLASIEVSTGNLIKTYKQNENIVSGVAILRASDGLSSILSVQNQKPLIHQYLPLKEGVFKRIVTPGKLSAIAVSPDEKWLAAGTIEGAVYVWNIRSGALVSLQTEAHFQSVTCLAWSWDSSIVVTGGADARVLVWRLVDLLAGQGGKSAKYVLTAHSLAVSGCAIGAGTFREARLYTVSPDSTCCVFDLFTGTLLYTLVTDSKLFSIAIDPAERAVYLGAEDGVHAVPLYQESATAHRIVAVGSAEGGVVSTNSAERVFKQASEEASSVTALALSLDASVLYVGSSSGEVAAWEVGSGQLIRKYRSPKGGVCSIMYVDTEFSSTTAEEVPVLQRNVETPFDPMDFPAPADTKRLQRAELLKELELSPLTEIDSIFTFEDKEVAGAGADSEGIQTELEDLKTRHNELKKMYDALWARHTSK